MLEQEEDRLKRFFHKDNQGSSDDEEEYDDEMDDGMKMALKMS